MANKPRIKGFSERQGFTKPPIIQINSITPSLRNLLWNSILYYLDTIRPNPLLDDILSEGIFKPKDRRSLFVEWIAGSFLKVALDDLPKNNVDLQQWLKKAFYELEWYKIYDCFQYLMQDEEGFAKECPPQKINEILEGENSGYRLTNGEFVPITNEQEIKEIEGAIEKTVEVGLEGAATHLLKARSLLAKKPEPDYHNSTKESISAVASLVAILSEKGKDNFAPALEELSKKIPIHGALKQGFIKLYGYTSDEDGIRHPILEDPNSVGYDEAKFMLVACSAFVNYLISKANKAGLLKETAKM
ncbi:MAG: hypothetical protein Q6359_06175 [Candidatus Brocadiales bacterium]|nr:hypothetical protein [Candidatus Brocadiales bacterium]